MDSAAAACTLWHAAQQSGDDTRSFLVEAVPEARLERVNGALSEPRLDAAGQRVKVGHALHLVVGQLDAKMVFQAREQIQRLQAIDLQLFVEVVVPAKAARAAP